MGLLQLKAPRDCSTTQPRVLHGTQSNRKTSRHPREISKTDPGKVSHTSAAHFNRANLAECRRVKSAADLWFTSPASVWKD